MATRKASKKAKPAKKRPATKKKAADAPSLTDMEARDDGGIIDMDQAIELLKTTRPTFYRWLKSGKVKGMKAGRQWRFYKADIERFMQGEAPRPSTSADAGPLIDHLVAMGAPLGEISAGARDSAAAVDLIIAHALAMRASDIHFSPVVKEAGAETQGSLRYRIDGNLKLMAECSPRLLAALLERIKIMAACNPLETRPQDGRIVIKTSAGGAEKPRAIDLRASFVPALFGEAGTLRVFDTQAVLFDLERIEFAPADHARIARALARPNGLIFCTGPTGSGKTTALYSCLQRLTRPEVKIMSVEHPVEFTLPWVTQVPVTPTVPFVPAMRAVMRSAPNVILVGEIRDSMAAQLTIEAALTGHLVLTQMHTDDAVSALRRMMDLGVDAFMVAEATKLVIAQRLVRKLCAHCSQATRPEGHELELAAECARSGGLGWDPLPRAWREALGCAKCGHTGYRGRTVIAETLAITSEIASALMRGASNDELRALAVTQGMTTLAADGVRRAAEGKVSLTEVLRITRRA